MSADRPTSVVRMAVVGVGHMGRFHAEKITALAREEAGAELVAVMDADPERAAGVSREHGVDGVTDLDEVLGRVDAIVVAVPTAAHAGVVERALDAGVDVLVEKPIAATLEEAEKLLGMARERGRVLQVGHLEWFNSAMESVRERVTRPRFIEAHRMGPFTARATDVDVVRDLMIHDIDIIQRLVGQEPERVESIGVPVITERVDIANARLTFPNGAVANVTASRVSPTPMRKIRFFQTDGYFSIDFGEQSVVIAQRGAPDEKGERQVSIDQLKIDRGDALLAQLRSFVRAVRAGSVEEGAGIQGLAALRTAFRVIDAMPSFDDELAALSDDDGTDVERPDDEPA